jgi:hypothetical protein
MWVRLLKYKDDACSALETIMLEIQHLHARHHSSRHHRLGVGVQFSAPYAHHMFGKAERPWRSIRDNAYAMLYTMAVPDSMWSCAVNNVVYLRNRTYNRSVGLTGGIPLTLLTSSVLDASKFRVFGCAVFAKVPDKLRRKLREKAFRGVIVGYPTDAPGSRV